MTEHPDQAPPASAVLDDEFERMGRAAGAELRTPAPRDGHRQIERTSTVRRATIATLTAGTTLAVVVGGLLVLTRDPQPQENNRPVEVTTTTSAALTPTSLVSSVATAGSFRVLADYPLAPKVVASATWTGEEAIVLGVNEVGGPLSAVAFHLGRNEWRQLAAPPAALPSDSFLSLSQLTSWTGSELLVSTNQAEVFVYHPAEDEWSERQAVADSAGLASADSLVAVSTRGVLARASRGWWWYDNSTDGWQALTSPALGVEYSTIDVLDSGAMVATQVDGSTITSAVFDIDSRTWRDGPPVELVSQRGDSLCDAADGLLVCFAEGYGTSRGVVIDPLVGSTGTFMLGGHSSSLIARGIPWFAHAWKLLIPRTATWEDLPVLGAIDGFRAAVWTGSEVVFFGGGIAGVSVIDGTTAAYTPIVLPGG